MPLFSVTADSGETVQVDTDNLTADNLPSGFSLNQPGGAADGYVTRQHFDAQLDRARQQAGEGMVSVEDAATDEQVVQAVLAAHESEDGVDLEAYQSEWEEQNLAPVQQQLQATQQQVNTQALIEAGRQAGVREEYLEGGADSYLAHRLGGRLEFDPEHGTVATDGDGNRLPGGEGRAFASAQDLLGRMQQQEGAQGLFSGDTPQGGGGSIEGGSGSGGGSGRSFSRSEIAGMSPEEFEKNADAINKAAAEGRITD